MIPYQSASIMNFYQKKGTNLAFSGYNTSLPSVPISIGTNGGRKLWNVKNFQICNKDTNNFIKGKINSLALGYSTITNRNVTLVKEIIEYIIGTFFSYKKDSSFS